MFKRKRGFGMNGLYSRVGFYFRMKKVWVFWKVMIEKKSV